MIGNEWTQFIYENGHVVEKTCRAILAVDPEIVKIRPKKQMPATISNLAMAIQPLTIPVFLATSRLMPKKRLLELEMPVYFFRNLITVMAPRLWKSTDNLDRPTDCTERTAVTNLAKSKLELKENPFSGSNKRVHFTPLGGPRTGLHGLYRCF